MTMSSDPIAQQSRARRHSAKFQAQLQADLDRKPPNSKPSESKGKLPGVSQAVKRSVFSRLSAQSNEFDTPKELATTTDAASHKQRVSECVKSASSKKPVKPVRGRKRNVDEELMTSQPKQKQMTNSKRKAVTDAIEVGKQVKRSRVPSTNSAKSYVTGTNREERGKSIAQSHSFIASPQLPPIRSLLGSQSPAEHSDSPFKKPILPARSTQTLTTPTKPRTKPVGKRRLHTPKGARRRSWDELYQLSSSPSVSHDTDTTGDWLQTGFDQEIMSSNSKPVPASPNAESTAISGHADRDDVVSEKRTGDSQTEKSNPFIQRRADRKATSFLRRLTGEDQANERVDSSFGSPHGVQITVNSFTSLEAKALAEKSRMIAPHMPSQKWNLSDLQDKTDASETRQIDCLNMSTVPPNDGLSKREHKPNESPKHKQCTVAQVKQAFPQKGKSHSRQSSNNREDHDCTYCQSRTLLVAKSKARSAPQNLQVPKDTKIHDFSLPGSYEIFENTPIKHTTKFFSGYIEEEPYFDRDNDGDDTTLPTIYTSSPPTFLASLYP
ncbi:hypothetical protein PTMSG1_07968 [Pyrenophora teres f. maculata]|nr:hypothetical protein PTMSG1_07968 [Pyrenophora teres f. maculata]